MQHLPEYAKFVERLPEHEDYDAFLIYYELALYEDRLFFYWSGVRDGKCTAFYTIKNVDYEPITDCQFPRLEGLARDVGDDMAIMDGSFIGATAFRSRQIDRRFVIPPLRSRLGLSLGMPPDGDLTRKIEVVWSER